jgi:hypothetical protein
MSQTTLDVAYGILLANLIPFGIVAICFVIYFLGLLGLDFIDVLKDKFLRKNK